MTTGSAAPAKVEMRGIAKRFGETEALRGVDFSVRRGEIHGLLGENGAGKTTLMNVLSGLYRADRGEVLVDGRPVAIRSPHDALGQGIGMVHQHVELIPNFTVLENVLLGREGDRLWLRVDRHRRAVDEVARRFGLAVELDAEVRGLAAGVQQKVEILKALYRGVEVLILDEPTTMLTPQEVDVLFGTISAMTDGGVTVVFITHKIREILANCDRVTVMRAGQVVDTLARADAEETRLVELMIGQRLTALAAGSGGAAPDAPPRLEVVGLGVPAEGGEPAVRDVGFALRAGELVGLAGVAGNGQRELAEALIGLVPAATGAIRVAGLDVTHASVRDRLAAGLVWIPEDRLHDGLLPGLSVAENLVLGLHPGAFERRGLFDHAAARALADAAIREYGIVAPGAGARAIALSGGNIQKLLVARALELARRVGGRTLIAANPTRGLDVRATDFVRRRLVEFAAAGGAVLLISEDLDELLGLAHRMLVVYRGRLVADLPRRAFDAYRIGALMAGAAAEAPAR
jgi:simple sugar transport system ATP-binding protein